MNKLVGKPKPGASALARLVADLPWGSEGGAGPSVRLEFTGGRKVHANMRIGRTGNDRKDAERELAAVLGKDAASELLASENRLFEWLAMDDSHPTRFALDPLASLAAAGIKLSERASAVLRSHRDTAKRIADASAARGLASLKIELAASEKTRKR
jgi:hypothetical protein